MPKINGTYVFLITFAILLVPFFIILKRKFVCCDEELATEEIGRGTSCPPENSAGEVAIDVCEGEIKAINSDCSICIAEIKKGEMCVILHPCCHGFHYACAGPWFQDKETCPLCRTTVSHFVTSIAS
ncbi:hypothetical protein RND71_029646 [Anisodus tanguticus]|uniref:RING-type domain-containing protein n=1 Tax=Anisodus tanguticus TaxID=243964 RepID=A0AAE1UYX4_9SOLA|nr:hypothetical protein RND71_029646 [Anisodus tanguticus]